MPLEEEVAGHYSRPTLIASIEKGLIAAGKRLDALRVEDLAPVDEFHIGGRAATEELAEQLGLRPGRRVLDIGCGIGGAARLMASRHGCCVAGVDLTPDFVATARALTERVGLAGRIEFHVASATALPFADGSFDAATLLHVGMNIPDKRALAAEVARVLTPGGMFGIYDAMRTGEGALPLPLPWASAPEHSFLAAPAVYVEALSAAGFEIVAQRNRRDAALRFFRERAKAAKQHGPPPLGLHLIMGEAAGPKMGNLIAALEAGSVAPVEIVCRR